MCAHRYFFLVSALRLIRAPVVVQLHAGGILHLAMGSCQEVLPPNSYASWISSATGTIP